MKKTFDIILRNREIFLKLMSDLSLEQLNKIPEGYNNNIVWNFAHLLAAHQTLCYKNSGKPMPLNATLIERYKKDTKPEGKVSQEEFDLFKKLAIDSLYKFKEDYDKKYFDSYTTYTTGFGVELTSVEDAFQYVAFHEGIHLGIAMALKKLVK